MRTVFRVAFAMAAAWGAVSSIANCGGGGSRSGPATNSDASGGSDATTLGDAASGSDSPAGDGGSLDQGDGQGSDAGSPGQTDGAMTNVTSITKDGVTWTFSAPASVGQFVNGDYYVVGPVTVTSISPTPQNAAPYMNGSVLDLPTKDGKSAFDQRLNDGTDESYWFNAADRVYAPVSLKPGDSLASSISLPACNLDGGAPTCTNGGECGGAGECQITAVMRSGDQSISPVASVSVLTVIGAAVSADTFRPSYCDRGQTLYHADALNRSMLPSLAPPTSQAGTPTLAVFENWLRRPWIDMNPFLFDAPAEYMPDYGERVAFVDSYVGLLLELNFPAADKVNLTNYFVQYGIDLFGCVKAGYGWPAFGGHRSGRKMPIVFAGMLLDDASMKNVSTTYPNQFGEDMQTVAISRIPGGYTQAWNGAKVIYGGHYGVNADGTLVSPGLYGPYEQLAPSNTNWPLLNGNEQLGESYRRCCTSLSWIGEALAIRILAGMPIWNYQAFFDYADRWMDEPGTQTTPDSQCVTDILTDTGFDYSSGWEDQGQVGGYLQGEFPQYTFVDDMWSTYRSKY
jgi:hypothetical protein